MRDCARILYRINDIFSPRPRTILSAAHAPVNDPPRKLRDKADTKISALKSDFAFSIRDDTLICEARNRWLHAAEPSEIDLNQISIVAALPAGYNLSIIASGGLLCLIGFDR